MRVLVVDTDINFRMIAKNKLAKRGYDVHTCGAHEAISFLDSQHVDSVFMLTHFENIVEHVRKMLNPPLIVHYKSFAENLIISKEKSETIAITH